MVNEESQSYVCLGRELGLNTPILMVGQDKTRPQLAKRMLESHQTDSLLKHSLSNKPSPSHPSAHKLYTHVCCAPLGSNLNDYADANTPRTLLLLQIQRLRITVKCVPPTSQPQMTFVYRFPGPGSSTHRYPFLNNACTGRWYSPATQPTSPV